MNTLKDVKIGERVKVSKLNGDGALRQHFLDMGVIPGAEITVVKYAPMGDPIELLIHGYVLTLRLEDAAKIEVEETGDSSPEILNETDREVVYKDILEFFKADLEKKNRV